MSVNAAEACRIDGHSIVGTVGPSVAQVVFQQIQTVLLQDKLNGCPDRVHLLLQTEIFTAEVGHGLLEKEGHRIRHLHHARGVRLEDEGTVLRFVFAVFRLTPCAWLSPD